MPDQALELTILIPVFSDEDALFTLLDLLDPVLARSDVRPRILIVDDGSPDPIPAAIDAQRWPSLPQIDVLELRANVGHQRAIAVGLAWLENDGRADAVLVMDGDGEDDPADVPRLIEHLRKNGSRRIVFAERTKRSETAVFRLCYWLYRQTHFLLTGIKVRVGNFSVIPRAFLRRLVVSPHLWNHYAAAVFKGRVPFETIKTSRAPRLAGSSRMNFVSLGVHGLSALSVFGEIIGVRLGLAAVGGLLAALVALALLALNGPLPVSIALCGLFVGLLCQTGAFLLLFVFVILQGRSTLGFLPARDYVHFVGRKFTLEQRQSGEPSSGLIALGAHVGAIGDGSN